MSSSRVGKPLVMTVARRYLMEKGVEALRPQRVSEDSKKWIRPLISRRKAAVMRKAAIADGTFGSFDTSTGIGWDPQWDVDVYHVRGNISALRPPKGHKRERTRETRAQKIESNLATVRTPLSLRLLLSFFIFYLMFAVSHHCMYVCM